MLRRRFAATVECARRVLPVALAAAFLVGGPFGPLAWAQAQEVQTQVPPDRIAPGQAATEAVDSSPPATPPDVAIWLQAVVLTVHPKIPTFGQLRLQTDFSLSCSQQSVDCPTQSATGFANFPAQVDDTVTLDRPVPVPGDQLSGPNVWADFGIPLFDPRVAQVNTAITQVNPDGGLVETGRTSSTFSVSAATNWNDGITASASSDYYDVTFLIRKTPLADLVPRGIGIDSIPDSSDKRVCLAVQNQGRKDTGPFEMQLAIDGTVPANGTAAMEHGLMADKLDDQCIQLQLPTSGRHELKLTVDTTHVIPEMDETNNVHTQTYFIPIGAGDRAPIDSVLANPGTGGDSAASGGTGSGGGPPKADLTIQDTLLLNGQPAGAQHVCKIGQPNDVTVFVKNGGDKAAPGVWVKLDWNNPTGSQEESAGNIDPGNDQQVIFHGVILNQGSHQLTANADPSKLIDEADENNNSRPFSVNCQP